MFLPAIKYVGLMVNSTKPIDIVCEKPKRMYVDLRMVIANIVVTRESTIYLAKPGVSRTPLKKR
ncbi:hypothetical protein GQX74_013158 [Glossina fuscipes]|nr:hypothetical protein GQX74_013158 [Glossina fuscipes]